ncbi:hypothetical protein [Sutcliffiella rhizosphaerae]|uniref:Flagellar protein FliT n=1 Tax=Sutcliffiella rhizosphaerae TaxID=2880967 RepID=A0ABN8AD96_9BACI|nr:hypothetical protein [Sutcliffiella rhizosphaerae]CAG9621442.1 hypothetical protein BACCIP111883_02215 [Sutcliffiella rhizosphaerae]
MTIVESLDKITSHLIALLESPLPAEEKRDSFMEEIDQVLQAREELIAKLSPPFSDIEMVIGKKVALASQEIPTKLEAFQRQIKQEWGQLQQSKKTVKAYENPYNAPTADGMYYDKRN